MIFSLPYLTGTTIGILSFIGCSPKIFFAPIAGRILDVSPGIPGHRNYFLVLATISVLGLAIVFSLVQINKRRLLAQKPRLPHFSRANRPAVVVQMLW